MGYQYHIERQNLFNEAGQVMFMEIRDRAKQLLKTAGAFRLAEVISGTSGDSWRMLACVDRMVELKEIREVHPVTVEHKAIKVQGQDRIFTYANNS